jgi:transposase
VGAAGAADPQGVTGRATAQDGHAGGDERHSLPAAHRLSVALPAARRLSALLDVYNIFRKLQREGTWEAIWAELHMSLRERMGREASRSAAVLDSQSVKSAEKGAVKTTKWVTTPAKR